MVDNIADGERIWSARFIGDRGYLVTFETIDPLWVLDLSDPFNPVILGELEVPGVSTYIHPVNENTLLTIGIGPGVGGLGLDWSTTQVSLFDVSDPSAPNLADSMKLTPAYTDSRCEDVRHCGWSWSWSEATYEHKAFTYWSPDSILAVPLSTYRYLYDESGYSGYEYVSKLMLVDVDVENRLWAGMARLIIHHSTIKRTEIQTGGMAIRLVYADPFSWEILFMHSRLWESPCITPRTLQSPRFSRYPDKSDPSVRIQQSLRIWNPKGKIAMMRPPQIVWTEPQENVMPFQMPRASRSIGLLDHHSSPSDE